jgi:hypothetical protein
MVPFRQIAVPRRAGAYRTVYLTLALLASCAASESTQAPDEVGDATAGVAAPTTGAAATDEETLYYLDAERQSLTQPIDAADGPSGARFVRIEVVDVSNPDKHPLTFEVHYQPQSGEREYLGSFGLYPPDNPGTFIVSTQGKVGDGGAVVLLMKTAANVDSESIKVGVKRMKLTDG